MAYNDTIPALGNLIGNDIPAIKENFVQLTNSRMVDDNLDVASPSNGYYVRWENGLQICFGKFLLEYISTPNQISYAWTFPVSFGVNPIVNHNFNVLPVIARNSSPIWQNVTLINVNLTVLHENNVFLSGDQADTLAIAIGVSS